MLYHLPWIARNFHIHRVISLSPVSRGFIRLSRHQIRLQKHDKPTLVNLEALSLNPVVHARLTRPDSPSPRDQ